jgi:hypothetical protein
MIDIEQFLMSLGRHKDADGKLKPIYLADTIQEEIEIIKEAIKHSRRWVGLTDEDLEFWTNELGQGELGRGVIRAVADHLKEKNT